MILHVVQLFAIRPARRMMARYAFYNQRRAYTVLVIADGENRPLSHHRDFKEKERGMKAAKAEIDSLQRVINDFYGNQ